jgi:hypothetical protein
LKKLDNKFANKHEKCTLPETPSPQPLGPSPRISTCVHPKGSTV